MTLGDLFERLTILEQLQAHFRRSSYTDAAEACAPSIVTLNERIEAAMERIHL